MVVVLTLSFGCIIYADHQMTVFCCHLPCLVCRLSLTHDFDFNCKRSVYTNVGKLHTQPAPIFLD